jgi:hypothetical protein
MLVPELIVAAEKTGKRELLSRNGTAGWQGHSHSRTFAIEVVGSNQIRWVCDVPTVRL